MLAQGETKLEVRLLKKWRIYGIIKGNLEGHPVRTKQKIINLCVHSAKSWMDFGWAVELTVSIPEPQFYRVFFGENNQYPKLKVAPKKKRLFHGKFEFTGNVHAEM